MEYLNWDKKKIEKEDVSDMYNTGYLFTRIDKGVMVKTRSIRIDLNNFKFSSENRRILKKIQGVDIKTENIPYNKYNWMIGKMAKDFYSKKFGDNIFSVFKIKQLLSTDENNFNKLLIYTFDNKEIGYSICYINNEIMHYSYPFYNTEETMKDIGLGMMIKAIEFAKSKNLKYIYLGSLQRPKDRYKLQFEGIEWFDGNTWTKDIEEAKKILSEIK